MDDFKVLLNLLPQGTAVAAVVSAVSLILLKFVPTLIKEFRETVQGVVATHSETLREERELFRGELKELRSVFKEEIKGVSEAFATRNDALAGRIDNLADTVRGLKDRMEK